MKIFLVLVATLLAGCATNRSLSTIVEDHTAYDVNEVQARQIIESSLREYLPHSEVDSSHEGKVTGTGSLTKDGQVQTITITTQKVSGINARGGIKDGFGFIVSEQGAMLNQSISQRIYGMIKYQGSVAGEVLATAKPSY